MLKLITKFWLPKSSKCNKGFTLTEILIGSVISIIITTTLLTAMVEILTREREEGILTQTQQEMERAIKYISNDIRESVYVYDFTQAPAAATCGKPYPLCGLPDFTSVGTPIIAFWKVVSLPDSTVTALTCAANATNIIEASGSTDPALNLNGECVALKNRRKMYSLVVYLQATTVDPNWRGQSRILRYELPKYNSNVSLTTRNTGFVDPSYTKNFVTWPYQITYDATGTVLSINNLQPTLPTIGPNVLVDFVDDPNSTADANLPTCSTGYTRIPATNATNTTNTSFFTCITTIPTTTSGQQLIGQNQDVMIYLRGNAAGQPGLRVVPGTNNTVLTPLLTRVTLRGIVDKSN